MANMRNGEITSGAEYRMNEQLKKFPIFGVSIVFQVVKFWKLVNFPNCYESIIWKIIKFSKLFNLKFSKFYNLENQYYAI